MSAGEAPELVLFDLDGTLADTARDLLVAMERLCETEGVTPPALEPFRRTVSLGAKAMLKLALGCEPEQPRFVELRHRFLSLYRENLAQHTDLFPGIAEVLAALELRGLKWGVVTNKPHWLTEPLLRELALEQSAACIVSGDTLPRRKPDPDQLLLACETTGTSPRRTVYVGDSRSDIEAGRRAGMRTVAVEFGYIPPGESPSAWGADKEIASPGELIEWLDSLRVARTVD